jgi:hypothetical protein
VAEQAGAKGSVEVGDGGQQGAKQPDLGTNQFGKRLWRQADGRCWAERSRANSSAGLRPPR